MMNIQLNRWIGISLMVAVALLVACGDAADEDSSTEGTAPSISNLSLSPTTMNVGEQTQIQATFDFEDPDGDVDTMSVSVTLPDGRTQSLGDIDFQNGSGTTAGPAVAMLALTPPQAGEYGVSLRLTDDAGNESNELSGSVQAEGAQ